MGHDLEQLETFGKPRVRQKFELAEMFGFETRNRYEISDDAGHPVFYAGEQGKGFLASLGRYFMGHWRTFEIHFFNPLRQRVLLARHPFRWFLQRLEVYGPHGELLGALQQRWSFFSKRFEVEGPDGRVLLTVNSPAFSLRTFRFMREGVEVAQVTKKWGGLLTELFTDKDQLLVDFQAGSLDARQRAVLVAAAIFIDLQYFEQSNG